MKILVTTPFYNPLLPLPGTPSSYNLQTNTIQVINTGNIHNVRNILQYIEEF